jgi:hypothetical protein
VAELKAPSDELLDKAPVAAMPWLSSLRGDTLLAVNAIMLGLRDEKLRGGGFDSR